MRQLQLLAFMILCNTICYNNQTYTYQEPINFSINGTQVMSIHKNFIFIIPIALSAIILSCIFKHYNNDQNSSSSSQITIKGNGISETKKLDITGITQIYTGGIGNLIIEQDETQPELLTITADENVMPYLKHALSGISHEQLSLGIENNVTIQSRIPITYHAIIKNINKISSSGTMDIQSKNTIKTNVLDIDKSGTGNINLSIDVDKVILNHSGTSNTELSGTATEQKINFSGTGKYNAYKLLSQKASLNLSGVGTAHVNVKNKLAYTLSGIGSIYYKGNPELNGSTSGLGKIKKA
jgi:hypothetical protein